MEYRIERDSMGEVRVPADRYWGAQTQRSHENFPIGVGIETMPTEIIRAFAVLKKAAAIANRKLLPARMSAEKCAQIGRVCCNHVKSTFSDSGKSFPLIQFCHIILKKFNILYIL